MENDFEILDDAEILEDTELIELSEILKKRTSKFEENKEEKDKREKEKREKEKREKEKREKDKREKKTKKKETKKHKNRKDNQKINEEYDLIEDDTIILKKLLEDKTITFTTKFMDFECKFILHKDNHNKFFKVSKYLSNRLDFLLCEIK
jgi:chromatin remodeling complex protein RSC6